ncbi:MAG: cell division protein FtsQ [Geobacteraceae bacterium]|nr:cell division protein FtsQ [Geobacteraceae bacterium]
MRDLNHKKQRLQNRNRPKKQKKSRKPINYRRFLKRGARIASVLAIAAILVVVCLETYELLARATFFRLEKIEASKSKRLKREEIIALSGVKPGDSMLRLDLRRVAAQIKKNPWVEKVRVNRYFPRTLSIEITEWEPAAVVNMGYLYYLDGKGEIFKPLTKGDNLDFPVITGITGEDLSKDPAGCKVMLKTALQLADLLKAGTVFKLADISEIHVDKGYGYTLFTAQGGVPVKLGNGNFPEKLTRLARIYKELSTQLPELEYIDLNYNDKIVVKKV